MKILIINGPNLNLLGIREPNVYGKRTFEEFIQKLKAEHAGIALDYFQSNIEGEIVTQIQDAGFTSDGIILNAGAYTHTSVAIRDAIASVSAPVIEVHLTNLITRESFRHLSVIGPVCRGSIMGFGLESYRLALLWFVGSE